MKLLKVSALALIVTVALVSPTPKNAYRGRRSLMSPRLRLGPKAIASGAKSGNYSLFVCQVTGLNSGGACYDPYQIRHAYQINALIQSGINGHGKTIVIIDAFQAPNLVEELNTFDGFYQLPGMNGLGGSTSPVQGTFTQVAPDGLTPFVPGNADMTGWAEEISLDVTWAHSIAPGANITLVLAKSDSDADILSATKYAIDHRLGDVISQSFGENESCMDPALLAQQSALFAEATANNVTLFASSGDFGSAQLTCDGQSFTQAVSTPADEPLVTSVGGTDLHAGEYCFPQFGCNPATSPAPGTYLGETVWNEPAYGAGGGGFSVIFSQPSYQKGIVPGKQRGVPDVSYNAAVLDGVLVFLDIPGLPVGMYSFGGTSAGSPQWAAIIAMADQLFGSDLGFIDTALYHTLLPPPRYSVTFNDITIGNNSFFGVPGFNATPGWDAASGLGTPKAAPLVSYLLQNVSPGDGLAAIGNTKPLPNTTSSGKGSVTPY